MLLVEAGAVIVEDRNSSRHASEEELLELGILECSTEGSRSELAEAGLDEHGHPTLIEVVASSTMDPPMSDTAHTAESRATGSQESAYISTAMDKAPSATVLGQATPIGMRHRHGRHHR